MSETENKAIDQFFERIVNTLISFKARVGRFLPGSEKNVFSMVKTGLAKIVFAAKIGFCRQK